MLAFLAVASIALLVIDVWMQTPSGVALLLAQPINFQAIPQPYHSQNFVDIGPTNHGQKIHMPCAHAIQIQGVVGGGSLRGGTTSPTPFAVSISSPTISNCARVPNRSMEITHHLFQSKTGPLRVGC
jgi:hypothetical protein